MPDSFERATHLERISDTEHRVTIPDGWQQGRGAFGGLVLGMMLDAMIAREDDKTRRPRAFCGDLCGPALPKESRIETLVMRRGKNQTNLRATLFQDDGVVASASCILASARHVKAPARFPSNPPGQPSWKDFDVAPIGAPMGPTFAQHYEYRLTGALPFSGGPVAEVTGFIRERVPLEKLTEAAILGRLDSFWPALFSIESSPRPMATVTFMAELLCDPTLLDPKEPMFYRARAPAEASGYFVEFRELWLGTQPIAFNQQCFAMLA